MEAMQSGLPLVIADYGGMAEYVSDKAGFKVPVTSESALIQGLADKISLLSTHPELREEMGFAAKRESSQFTWAQKGRDLLEIYQSVKGAL